MGQTTSKDYQRVEILDPVLVIEGEASYELAAGEEYWLTINVAEALADRGYGFWVDGAAQFFEDKAVLPVSSSSEGLLEES